MATSVRDAVALAIVSFAWLLVLSSWMGKAGHGTAFEHDNIFFGADTGTWLARIVSPSGQPLPDFEVGPHPLAQPLIRPLARALDMVLTLAGIEANRLQVTGRAIVALFAAVGVGGLALTAGAMGINGAALWILFAVYLLSSSSVIVALPENFGVSNALLSLFFSTFVIGSTVRWRRWALPPLGLLVAGITITNVVLPLLACAQSWIASRTLRVIVVLFLVCSAPLALLVVSRISTFDMLPPRAARFCSEVIQFTRLFIRNDVTRSGFVERQALLIGAFPIVAPRASLRLNRKSTAIQLSSFRLSRYSSVGLVALGGWIALFVGSIAMAVTRPERRPYLALLGAWIAFNLVFHSVWGDQLFLYSPHWSWALFGVVLLGADRLPPLFVAAACLAIVPGQMQLLLAMKNLAPIIQ